MVKKTKEEALETRAAILSGAIDVFYEKGVASATLEQIATAAGVTRGAVYWHFKNKLDIFDALHEQLQLSVIDTVLADLKTDHPRPLQQLENLCIDLLLEIERSPERYKVLSIFFMKCDYSGNMSMFLERQFASKRNSVALFSQYFERAQRHGHLREDTDPRTVTLSLTFYLTGLVQEYLRFPTLFKLEEQAAQFMRQFFAGVDQAPLTPERAVYAVR